ncbi:fla cluster protein FlaF [Halobellus inordinatus]|uniref:fla cluster protein FlaF n=1 Tax=Halobellus inordinatus TaxID=1126236 RepID=UPI00210ACF83
MGFGVSGSTAVIFLGVLIASGTLYTAAAGSAEQISEARDDDQEDLLERRNTAIDVTRVVYYDDSTPTLQVSVENAGTTTLSVNGTSLLVDNTFESVTQTSVESDETTDVWGADQTLVLNTTMDQEPDHVKVVAENGIAASNTTVEVVN